MLSLEHLNALLLARAGALVSSRMIRKQHARQGLRNADHMIVFWLKRRGAIDANDRITDIGRAMIRTALDG